MTGVVALNTEERCAAKTRITLADLKGDTCSVAEAAEVLGIGRGLGYSLARRGQLPGALHLGRRLRVSVRALRASLGEL
jgi:excisionase family DNA binding protein